MGESTGETHELLLENRGTGQRDMEKAGANVRQEHGRREAGLGKSKKSSEAGKEGTRRK